MDNTMTKKQKQQFKPTVLIKDCNLTGGTTPSFEALARAIEANAHAIVELAKHVSRPQTLISVGDSPDA